ncbi:hypothetical protein B0H15DRAFT_846156 [Mycena belliarum]|uniref:Telomeric single stranded DNA binding POT1/Cdc13 domain-containing protein n=1 Tax=Mycena belliarum TaxID=1033014 RepID=A0AAD6U294_9AGAR|nr:hypothetical protein B0H15DRAFT_846156 [Mycena belliae]
MPKRTGDELNRESKRPKREEPSSKLFKDLTQKRYAIDLLTTSSTSSESGYISGQISMKWPPLLKYRVMIESPPRETGVERFEIEFSSRCAEALRSAGVEFKRKHVMYLSLKGAVLVEKKGGASMPILLKYAEDVAFEILPNGLDDGFKIDTFSRQEPKEPSEDAPESQIDWFLTPRPQETSRAEVAINGGDLMGIDEESTLSTSPTDKPTSVLRSTIAKCPSHIPKPLLNIGNSLATIHPRQPPSAPNHISSSCIARPTGPALVNAFHPPGPSKSRENPSAGNDSSLGLPETLRPESRMSFTEHKSAVGGAHPPRHSSSDRYKTHRASNISLEHSPSSKIPDGKSAATEVVLPPHRSPFKLPPIYRLPNICDDHASTSKLADGEQGETMEYLTRVPPVGSVFSRRSHSPKVLNQCTVAAESDPERILNKKQRKNLTRREKRKAKRLPPPDGVPSVHAAVVTLDPAEPIPPMHTQRSHLIDHTIAVTAIPQHPQQSSALRSGPASVIQPQHAPTYRLPQGFTSLSNVTRNNTLHSVIGVVTSITSPSHVRGRDWSSSLRIVDQSNCIEAFPTPKEGFRVNCFTKKYPKWLPAATHGDIVILHNIKTQEYNGEVTAVGYHDRMQWAVYNPVTGTIGHGDSAGAPECTGLDDGFGLQFSPFYQQATPAVVAHCVTLDDWWRSVKQNRENDMGTVHNISGATSRRTSSGRQHKLISDISSEDTGTYFDFTVELIHRDLPTSEGKPGSLYVTDYTPLSGGHVYQQDWCPSKLADHILVINLWEQARNYAENMVSGVIYSLRSVRVVTSQVGYREAKMWEAKVSRPDDADPHLEALLERRKEFGSLEEVLDSNITLIQDGKDKEHITCIVELLFKQDAEPVIYVSDYSCHPKLPAITEPWAKGLDGRVLEVLLDDEQAAILPRLVVGQHYQILHLRFQQSVTKQQFRGRIGGASRLIRPIGLQSSSKAAEWREKLIERKNSLKRPTETPAETPAEAPTEREPQISPTTGVSQSSDTPLVNNGHVGISIKEAISSESSKFTIRAKVIDFFPFRLVDAFVRTCSECKTILSEKRKCSGCNDVDGQHIRIDCVLRVLISDGNDELKVSVSGKAPLLAGLTPVILHDDPQTLSLLSERLKPLLNNLVEVHDAILEEQVIEPTGHMGTFVVERWENQEQTVYGLVDCQI